MDDNASEVEEDAIDRIQMSCNHVNHNGIILAERK